MFSRLTLLVALAMPAVAHAQSAPDDDVLNPAPEPTEEPPPPPVNEPVDEPADEPARPADTAPPADDAPPADPATDPAKPKEKGFGASPVVGLELGVGGMLSGGGVYGAGLGRGVVLGARLGRFTLEWHLLESYQQRVDDDLEAANTAHSLGIASYGVRFHPSDQLSLYGGFVRASIPVVRATYDSIPDRWTIEPGESEGIGPMVGVAVSKHLSDDWVTISAEARIGKLFVNDADPAYLRPTGPRAADGTIPVEMTTEPINPTLGMLIVSLRISPP